MSAAALTALLCLAAAAPGPALAGGDAFSSIPAPKAWLKLYPIETYSAFWHLSLNVRDLRNVLPKTLQTLKDNGAEPAVPLKNEASSKINKYQQLSFILPAGSADKTLAALKKLGEVASLTQTPALNPSAQEAKDKLDKLEAEREAGKEALAKLPNISSLTAELIDHLTQVDQSHQRAQSRILLNMELQEAAAQAKAPKKKASR